MQFFENVETMEELKERFRELVKENHPDRGGDREKMKQINEEYELLFNNIKEKEINQGNKKAYYWDADDRYREIVNELLEYPELEIEIVGSWLWIGGNTYKYKEQLKELNFSWSSSKKKWYWYDGINKNKKKKGTGKDFDKIKEEYGHEKIKEAEKVEAIA